MADLIPWGCTTEIGSDWDGSSGDVADCAIRSYDVADDSTRIPTPRSAPVSQVTDADQGWCAEEAPAALKKTTVREDLERTMQEQYRAQLKGELVAKKQKFTGDLVPLLLACEHCRMVKKECFFVNRLSGQLEKCVKCVLQKKKCEGAISKSFLLQSLKSQLDRTSRSIRDGCPRTLNGDEGTLDYS